jgi:hypothetical protein
MIMKSSLPAYMFFFTPDFGKPVLDKAVVIGATKIEPVILGCQAGCQSE